MSPVEIVIVVVVGVAFLAAVGGIIYRKVKHKGGCCGCDCGCSDCPGCSHGKTRDTQEK